MSANSLACIAIGMLLAADVAAATVEKFTVLAAQETVGSLRATVAGRNIGIDYQVSNNGRGPKLSERIELGTDRLPASWIIEGTTAFGGKVAERFTRTNGQATWESQADRGSMAADTRALYVANDASPWSYGIYASALLRAKNRSLDVIPGGTLKLEQVREMRIGDASVVLYMLTGVNLNPDFIVLDRSGKFFAHAESSSVIVRAGYEEYGEELIAATRAAGISQLEKLQQSTAHRYEQPLRIRNVRIFDPVAEQLGAPASVVVYRDRIASVQPYGADENIAGETVIDAQGGTLLPGLHDMHSHNTPWSGVFYLAAGVTNVRDLGNDNEDLLQLVRQMDAGILPGPRVVRAGLLEGRSPHSARIGRIPQTLPEALRDVQWYADRGYRQIKIYNSMTPDWVAPIAAQAHALGLRVSGHIPAFMSPDRAIRDGYDEINHLNQLVLGWTLAPTEDTRTPLRLTALGERSKSLDLSSDRVRATIDLMKEHGIALDPTMVIIERLLLSRAGKVAEGDAPYLDHMPIGYQRYRRRSFVDFQSAEQEQTYVDSFERLMQTLLKLHEAGIRLLPGTDDGTGFTLLRELELYVKAGIPAPRVLSMATLGCAQYLGLDQQLGSIAPGKLADFLLVEGDPTRDISAIRRTRLVMKNDSVYFPNELYQAIGIQPFTVAPTVTPAKQ